MTNPSDEPEIAAPEDAEYPHPDDLESVPEDEWKECFDPNEDREYPLADECSLCGLPRYDFVIDVADEPRDGEYRWAHEVCYTFDDAVERHHENVQGSSDEARTDGGQVEQSTDGTDQMADEREVRYDEKYLPSWVVLEAVGRAIGEDVKGIESRSADTFAVLVEDGDSDE